jgi:hypothetical protein
MKLMRLLALSLAAAVVIAVGVQGAVGAPEAMHVKVTGKDSASQSSVKPLPEVTGVLDRRHEVWAGRQDSSDARVSGRYRVAFDVWEYRDESSHFADMSMTLSNAKGSWRADSFGVNTRDGSHLIRALAYGQGAYRGLRYVAIVHDKASGSAGTHLFDVDGWIERGTAPAKQPVATGDVHDKVTGTIALQSVIPGGWQIRNGVEKSSDPRTSGAYVGTMKRWTYPDGRMHFFGNYKLENELGVWRGELHGVVTVDRRYIQFVDARGTGAFAGLRYRHVDSGRYPESAPKTIKLSVVGWIESVE